MGYFIGDYIMYMYYSMADFNIKSSQFLEY